MVEDVIDKYHRKKAAQAAADKAEAERLKRAAAAKAVMSWRPEIGQAICDLIAEGATLKDVCRREDMPSHKLARQWIAERPEFAQALREAEHERLSAWQDELLIRARDDSRDRIARADGGVAPDPTAVARSKLLCDTLVRLLRAHHPTVWGDALTVKQPEPDFGAQLRTLPLSELERMRDNARKLEADDEVREMLAQKRAMTELNRERKARGHPPLSLAKFLAQ